MTRHNLVIKIDQPTGTIDLNFKNEDAGHLRLKSVQVRGVISTSYLYISFSGFAFLSTVYGINNNNTNQYLNSNDIPLPIIIQPNNVSDYQFQKPLTIMGGDNLMTATQKLEYKIVDTNGTLATFQDMTLILDFIPRSQYNQINGDRQIDNKIKTNLTERHEAFTIQNYSSGHRPYFGY